MQVASGSIANVISDIAAVALRARAMVPPAMGRARKADARATDRGQQLSLPVGAEPAEPSGRAARPPAREETAPARPALQQAPGPKLQPPVILQLGPREFAVLAWIRDEGGKPVYRIVQQGIKAASTAAVIARRIERER